MIVDQGRWAALGWDDGWAQAFATLPGLPARVARVDRGWLRVLRDDGDLSVTAPTSGDAVITGDWVAFTADGEQPRITAITSRRTALTRRDPGSARPQTLAANMDRVWIVHSVDQPLRAGWLDRALVVAHGSGAPPLIVVTKADLGGAGDVTADIAALAPDVEVATASSVDGRGIAQLAEQLRHGHCAALLGRSGSGKSSLINALAGSPSQLTGEVRAGDAMGRHTTTRRSLTLVSGGSVIDTPGIRALGLWEPARGLALTFRDVADLATGCRFSDCSHRHEPGCAVRAAVDERGLAQSRYARYIALSDE